MAQATLTRPTAPAITQTKLLIDNRWVDPVEGGTFDTYNPATGEVIAKVAAAGSADVDKAVKAARRALEAGPWNTMDAADRGRLLFRLADLVENQQPRSWPRWNRSTAARRSRDSQRRHARRRQHAALLRRLGRQDRRPDRAGARQLPLLHAAAAGRRRRPDHPLELPAADAGLEVGPGPGLRQHHRPEAGRADAVDRPARWRAGHGGRLPRRASSTSSTAWAKRPAPPSCAHPDVDKIAFTGHVDTAKIIQKAAADTLKRTTFELGGKSPNVIFADADMEQAVGRRLPRHLLPRRPVLHGRQPAVRRGEDPRGVRRAPGREGQGNARSAIRSIRQTEQGPQVSRGADGQDPALRRPGPEAGAKLVTGGKRIGKQGLLRRADDLRQRQGRHGDRPGRDLWPGRQRAAVQGAGRSDRPRPTTPPTAWPRPSGPRTSTRPTCSPSDVKAGTVWVNCYHVVDTTTPFGGFKMSGQGRENGEAALEHYTEMKTVTVKLG